MSTWGWNLCFGPHVYFLGAIFAISSFELGKHGLVVLCLPNFVDNSIINMDITIYFSSSDLLFS
jgi:hypothetical protein